MTMPKALICDLDMTLIDSRTDIASALSHAVSALGGRQVALSEVIPWIGKGLRATIAGLLPDASDKKVDQIVEEYKSYFFDRCNIHTTLYPGVIETLRSLRGRGIKTAVASAKMTFMARRVCEVLGLDSLMDHVQGTDDFPGKPDPTVILLAAKALGVSAADAVFIGDTVMDMQAGKAAGSSVAAVLYGIGKEEELKRENPDLCIRDFAKVRTLFPDTESHP